jgi:hypothetical protein
MQGSYYGLVPEHEAGNKVKIVQNHGSTVIYLQFRSLGHEKKIPTKIQSSQMKFLGAAAGSRLLDNKKRDT